MTEEYYYIEEVSASVEENQPSDRYSRRSNMRSITETDVNFDTQSKRSQEIRLHGNEIEQQLEMAESRCNMLKGQVDLMKKLYNGMDSETVKPTKPNVQIVSPTQRRNIPLESKRKRPEKESTHEHKVNKVDAKCKTSKVVDWKEIPSRDVDLTKSTLSTTPQRDIIRPVTDAQSTITNIISGITTSVNRLTQLQVSMSSNNTRAAHNDANEMGEPIGIRTVKCMRKNAEAEKPYQTDTSHLPKESVASIKSKGVRKYKKRSRSVLPKKACSKQGSSVSMTEGKKRIKVTAKHVEKTTKINSKATVDSIVTAGRYKRKVFSKLKSNPSKTVLVKKSYDIDDGISTNIDKQDWKSDKLIEIYHNSAIKMITASEDSIPNKKAEKPPAPEPPKQRISPFTAVTIPQTPADVRMERNVPVEEYRPPLSPIEEIDQPRLSPRTYPTKNYQLPTIASKMKQVARGYFQNFTFKSIPFVAARATTPSHNLGINIQQVLSIIKGRKPVTGISPTLAYNIELAANKLGSRPLSALVSSLSNQMYNKGPCPVARHRINFAHLQEMAKEIPEEQYDEENIEYVDPDDDASKVMPSVNLAAGDKNVPNIRGHLWTAEAKDKEKCSCVPKPGVNFNEVCQKYLNAEDRSSVLTRASQMPLGIPSRTAHGVGLPVNPLKKQRTKPWNTPIQPIRPIDQVTVKGAAMSKKEKSLKEVLKNLHDEFAQLNEQYDQLKYQLNNSSGNQDGDELVEKFEKLEVELQNKEDEINMVMNLYREVTQLKQQVKVLKKRASQSSVVAMPGITASRGGRDFRDMSAAGHLTKLLRHIQQFQDTLKQKSTI